METEPPPRRTAATEAAPRSQRLSPAAAAAVAAAAGRPVRSNAGGRIEDDPNELPEERRDPVEPARTQVPDTDDPPPPVARTGSAIPPDALRAKIDAANSRRS